MNFLYEGIAVLEVPNEISIAFTLLGCPHQCKNCHSKDYWQSSLMTRNTTLGIHFSAENVKNILNNRAFKDHEHATCLLFLGGDWEMSFFLDTIKVLRHTYHTSSAIKQYNFAWYTSLHLTDLQVYPELFDYFDFIKTGPYIEDKGPLNKKGTNQQFWSRQFLDTTYLFRNEEKL